MSEKFVHFDADELLSAYLDGEVTETERASVEARLRVDPAARTLLQELGTLSGALKSLPRDPAPVDLQIAALQCLSRHRTDTDFAKDLEPAQPVAGAQRSTPTQRWFRRRELIAGVSALAATVLVVALLPWTQNDPANLSLVADTNAVSFNFDATPADAPATEWALSETRDSGAIPGRPAVALSDDKLLRTSDAMGLEVAATRGVASDHTGPWQDRSELAGIKAPGVQNPTDGRAMVSMEDQADDVVALQRLEPWQEIQPYLGLINQNSGVVTNFDMHVIDTVQAADQFQVLLMQNGMAVTDAEKSSFTNSAKAGNTAGSKTPFNPNEPVLVGVYIEADDTEPVTRTLETLARQNTLVGLKLQPPLQMPQEVVANSFGLPGQKRASEPADEQLTNGLIDAYIDVQFGRAAAEIVAQTPVSALTALDDSAQLTRLDERLNSPFPKNPSGLPQLAEKEAKDVQRRSANTGEEVPVSRYSQIVNVPQPVDWFHELQEQQRGVSNESLADLAFNKQLNGEASNANTRMLHMKRELQTNSANRFRVFFVLKPTNTATEPESVPSAPNE